jgi:hypothetical protein
MKKVYRYHATVTLPVTVESAEKLTPEQAERAACGIVWTRHTLYAPVDAGGIITVAMPDAVEPTAVLGPMPAKRTKATLREVL